MKKPDEPKPAGGKIPDTMRVEPVPKKEALDSGGMAKYHEEGREGVLLKFCVPKGKVANIMGVMNLLQSKFDTLEIQLSARDGFISDQDYEEKVKETFAQLGIEIKD
jgi:hypothetical protein